MTDTRTTDPRITLPAALQPAAPFRFPVVAATVPVVASVAIWLITGSMFALIFAALGPLAAIGTYIDSRVSARKVLRAETTRFARDLSSTQSAIEAYHRRESGDLAELAPPAIVLVDEVKTDSSRWMREPREVLPVHLGYGTVRSNLVIDGGGARDHVDSTTAQHYQRLTDLAANLQDAPIAVNARLGIAIFGNELLSLALARALAIQLARSLSPKTSWLRPRGVFSAELWSSRLPHRVLRTDGGVQEPTIGHELASVHWGQLGDDAPSVSISVVSLEQQVPSGHRIIIHAGGDSIAVVGHPDKHQRREFAPSFLGREQALVWALAAHEIASRDGLASSDESVPDSLAFEELLSQLEFSPEGTVRRAHSLESRPAVGSNGRLVVDLVAHGPHAIVGGTTGSGKSELLISWVLAMAAEASPDDVTFLLIDFKGGSAFAHLAQLPHTVGIITDLDEAAASRAFSSLRAELQHRERSLARANARDISEVDALPRLVIVVDEFAAMMGDYPELHALFSDIAARGRSLGVHLILCTQRPSGVVRDSLLANADLRISLRVNNGADSSAVIGSDRAAELPARIKGRAWVAHGSSSAELVQFALATTHDVLSVAERWPADYSPRRPWCEPLAEYIPLATIAELGAARGNTAAASPPRARQSALPQSARDARDAVGTISVYFGLTDLPDEQRQGVAEWAPEEDGNLLILGSPGSGKSTTIATIVAAATADPPAGANAPANGSEPTADPAGVGSNITVLAGGLEPAGFWDTVSALHAQLDRAISQRDHPRGIVLAIDDLDAVISRFDDEYRSTVLDRLARLLREGPSQRIWVVASAQRVTPALQSLAQLIPHVLRLRFANRQEFVLSGGVPAEYTASLPPGGGKWKGARVQVAVSAHYPPAPQSAAVATIQRTEKLVVASSRPAATTAALTAAGWHVRMLDGAPGSERELLIADNSRPIALIGSIDEWQSRWGALGLLRTHSTVLLDGCSLSDYRQLARTRELPPPLTAGAGHYWKISESGAERVRLPL
ncbi:FtsK/SpoIIIE domain-containing protein [Salinibacterium sp. PAMC 21357]|uniref:FtsK/SpoIIIE domain-containing protein n=1 Tax=Salinibacterium sp. PAMC 21357 TaxID=1112215 RepID=UPI000287CA99|nr:FtsK/SpoIIIE domain-containing protein [Salinibacterium sp. PAMC 21357]